MPRDLNLILNDATTAVTTTTTGTAIDCVGGEFVVATAYSSVTPTDANETVDIEVQASFDSGSTYVTLARFPQLVKAANKGNAGTRVATAFYLPRANGPAARGADTPVKVRWKSTVSGTTPSFTLLIELTYLQGTAYGQVGNTGSGRTGMLDNIKNFAA